MLPRPGERLAAATKACRLCGHWSSSPEFGMDISTGYCEVWEKLTHAKFVCDQFAEREQLKRDQAALMQEMDEGDDYDD